MKEKRTIEGYMTDSQGRLVPAELVSAVDKLRDQTVYAITMEALKMQEQLAVFKKKIKNDLVSYLTLSYERYGKQFGGKKGNVQQFKV